MATGPEHPDPAVHWRHRRRLAYAAMLALLVTLAAALLAPIRESVIPLLEGLAWTFTVIILGYFGNNAIESFSKGKR